jgi:NDP-sugar pyrophosphorylase family protein
VKAVVLVGGEGTRLRPLTYHTPKPLLPVANQPFLERQLAWMSRYGIDEAVLSLGYLPDAFARHFTGDRFGDLRLRYAVEDEPLGTAGAIRFAADVAGIDERFVVCNGDVLTSLDLAELVAFHGARGAQATIHLVPVADPSAFGVVPTYDDGEVRAFVEKPPAGEAPTSWINAGTYVLEPSVLDCIPRDRNVSIERETFPALLESRGRLYALERDVYWLDIGTPSKYREAHADVVRGALGVPPVADADEVDPGIWVQPGAVVDASTRLVPPVLIGPDSAVGPGAFLAATSIGARCTVGYGARVEGSVLHDGVTIGRAAEVVDCILGTDALVADAARVRDEIVVAADSSPSSPSSTSSPSSMGGSA